MDKLKILYGSQTGNAEDLAKRVGYIAKQKGYRVLVKPMDDFPLKLLTKQHVILFVCSTTGHGQEPENMKNFFNFIRRRDLPLGCLNAIKFAVYGLGDSSYSKFNYVAKILFNRLKFLGASEIQPLVTGDEQHEFGCDGIIYPKLDELWPILHESFSHIEPLSGDLDSISNSYEVKYLDSGDIAPEDIFKEEFKSTHDIKKALCTVNRRVTPDSHFQDTRFLSFDALDSIDYEPGDVCAIYPCNSVDNVNLFIERLNLDPKQRVSLVKKDPDYMVNYLYDYIPDGLTIYELVENFLDIQAIPRRSFFEFLWPISTDKLEKDKLKEFSTTEGQSELYDYCIQPKRTAIEVLMDFPKTRDNITIQNLFDIIPPIKPRSFSIASALCQHPNQIQLIVGVVNYKTRLRKIRKGLCSNYLASLKSMEKHQVGEHGVCSVIRFTINKSSFKLPSDPSRPIVMISPGLGIAPMRSFIEARGSQGSKLSSNLLYFGCRFLNVDFYFHDELQEHVDKGLLKLRFATSREGSKSYVQNLIIEDSDLIRQLIEKDNAIVYVAGNSKLPDELRRVLNNILMIHNGDSDTDKSFSRVKELESIGRIQYDCW